MSDSICVEVAYALPDKQRIVKLDVPPGTTALEAVTLSKLEDVFDELVVDSTAPEEKSDGRHQERDLLWRRRHGKSR